MAVPSCLAEACSSKAAVEMRGLRALEQALIIQAMRGAEHVLLSGRALSLGRHVCSAERVLLRVCLSLACMNVCSAERVLLSRCTNHLTGMSAVLRCSRARTLIFWQACVQC